MQHLEIIQLDKVLQQVLLSVFKDNVTKARSEFPVSDYLAFQAFLMSEMKGILFK